MKLKTRSVRTLFSLLFLASLTVGCGKQQNTTTRWNQLPVPIYADSSITASREVAADFQAALKFWEEKAGQTLFNYQGEWNSESAPYAGSASSPTALLANVIFFQNPWPFPMNVIGQTTVVSQNMEIQHAIIMINPDAFFCTGDCSGNPYGNSQRKNFAHELGHFLGLNHSNDEENVMYPVLQPGGELSKVSVDSTALKEVTQ